MIRIQNLTVSYGKQDILTNLNLTIKQGIITALIGPNGCGKSTLLKSIAGSLNIKSGSIYLVASNIKQLNNKQLAQQLSMLVQAPVTPEGVSVRQLVSFGRNPYLSNWGRLSQQDKKIVQQALVDTELTEFSERPLASLSGGQRQRAWIAMVLAQDTEYILLDEPTTYLDLSHQIELMKMMQSMNKRGKTIIVVLHDLNQACRYCDELVVLKDGQLQAQGTPNAIFNSDLLQSVFNLRAAIIEDPIALKPMCIAL